MSRLLTIIAPAVVLYALAARASLGELIPETAIAALLLSSGAYFARFAPDRADRTRLATLSTALAMAVTTAGTGSPALILIHQSAWIVVGLLVAERLIRAWSFGTNRAEATFGALGTAMLGGGLALTWLASKTQPSRVGLEAALAALLWLGALAWVAPSRRFLRAVALPAAIASITLLAFGLLVVSRAAPGWQLGLWLACAGPVWTLLFFGLRSLPTLSVLRSSRGLQARAAAARRDLGHAANLEHAARVVLSAFATEESKEGFELLTLDPARRLALDVNREIVSRDFGELERMAQDALTLVDSSIVEMASVRARSVREPSLRRLVDAMTAHEVGLIVICAYQHHPEGLLFIPQAIVPAPLSHGEAETLVSLGFELGRILSTELLRLRSEDRIETLVELHRGAERRVEALESELEQLRGRIALIGRHVADDKALHVAYSPTMRAAQTRAIELAPLDEPVLLVATSGSPAIPVARFMHDRGPRWQEPFIVADCASVEPELTGDLLFGSSSTGVEGWLRSAGGGTLVLCDVPTLPISVQRRLANALGSSSAAGVRLVATSRARLADLRDSNGLCEELAETLKDQEVCIPPLVERKQDLPSLVWVAIARASRVLAVEPVGVEPAAMHILVQYDWPGDVAELELVIERAVARARGRTIGPADLQPLGRSSDGAHPLDGTHAEVERRLLVRTLERAGGNKSKAARILGLKRTTFLDKLRRHALEPSSEQAFGDARIGPS